MNICIRADASVDIGTGHVMRCLVLAEDLRSNQCHVSFICRDISGNLINKIESLGFNVHVLPTPGRIEAEADFSGWMNKNWDIDAKQTIDFVYMQDIDWLIVDHYALELQWELNVKPHVKKLMVIDDLANREHHCDLLLDQNLYANQELRYHNLIPKDAVLLAGPRYLLLRHEFRLRESRKKEHNVQRIVISFGGSDSSNETMKTLQAIDRLGRPDIAVDVVLGFSNQHVKDIRKQCHRMSQTEIHIEIDYLADLMENADLAIGAGGSTTWERCYMGLPAITIETASNQAEVLSTVAKIGAIYHLGNSRQVHEEDLALSIQQLINSPERMKQMSLASKFVMKDYEEFAVVKKLIKGE